MKTNKGVTLVALVITIVILIVLSILTIRIVRKDGLIEEALLMQNQYRDLSSRTGQGIRELQEDEDQNEER